MAYGSELLVQSYSWLTACILVLLLVDGECILSVKTGTIHVTCSVITSD